MFDVQPAAGAIRRLAGIAVFAIFAASTLARAAEWPQFRGPNATGIAVADANPPVEFGPEKNVLWKTPLASGASSPVIAGDRIFLTTFENGKLATLCLARGDGAVLWRREAKAEKIEPFFEKFGSPAGPSCATDGERVVTYFGSCGLACHDLDGREIWRVPIPCIKTQDGFGTGNSPIIHDGRVYLLRDELGDHAGLFGFDVKTGAQLWRTPRPEFKISYCTPVVWDGSLVTIGELRAKGYDLATGAERWLLRGLSAYPCTTAAAGADGNLYLATWSSGSSNEPNPDFDELLRQFDKNKSGDLSLQELAATPLKDFLGIMDDNQNTLLERWEWDPIQSYMRSGKNAVVCVKPGGRGDITASHVVWKNDRGASYVASPLAFDHRLFLAKDGGFATCYDTQTGKLIYEKQRLDAPGDYYASPIFAAGKIYACSSRGMVVVIDAAGAVNEKSGARDNGALRVLARNDLREAITATPAIAGDAIFIRTAAHLWAFGENRATGPRSDTRAAGEPAPAGDNSGERAPAHDNSEARAPARPGEGSEAAGEVTRASSLRGRAQRGGAERASASEAVRSRSHAIHPASLRSPRTRGSASLRCATRGNACRRKSRAIVPLRPCQP